MLATIPTLAAIVALYGLIADPSAIGGQLEGLDRVLPEQVVSFLTAQLTRLARRSPEHLGLAFGTTVALALFSARTAARALIIGLNRAYSVEETRPPLKRF